MTSDPNPSLPRMHVPNSGKHFPRKHVSSFWGLLHKYFRVLSPKHFVGCPKNGETFSQKTRLAEIGTVAQIFPGFGVQNILSDVPKTGKLISRKHVWPKSALLHKDFRVLSPNHFVGCPKNGETFSQKTRLAENRTSIWHHCLQMGTNVHFFC